VDLLAHDHPARLDGQVHQAGPPVGVLVTARHHGPLAGDLVLVETAAP
jgi:hypothetical protein